MKTRFGKDNTWTGNDHKILNILFKDTALQKMGSVAMNGLVCEYTGSTRFVDRCKDMTVVRWISDETGDRLRIPFEDMLKDWMDLGLITEKIVNESLIIKKYEDAIEKDATIKTAYLEMADDCGVDMSIEDAIFNGLTSNTGA
jgi:hypothetical protein